MSKKAVSLVCLLLTAAVLFSFGGCSLTGTGEEEEATTVSVKTPLPTEQLYSVGEDGSTAYLDAQGNTLSETTTLDAKGIAAKNEAILSYYKLNSDRITDGSLTGVVTRSESRSIDRQKDADGNDIEMSENSRINAAIDTLKKYVIETPDTVSTPVTNDFSGVFPGGKYICNLSLDDVASTTCVDEETTRRITVTLKEPVPEEIIDANFDKEDPDKIFEELGVMSGYLTVSREKTKFTYVNCVIEITADLMTDDIISVSFKKGVNVDTEVTGCGSLEAVGSVPVKLLYTYCVTYTTYTDDFSIENPESIDGYNPVIK